MKASQQHPEIDRLSAFVLGTLGSVELESVEQHLSSCETCCDALKQMKEDTFVALVRRAREQGQEAQGEVKEGPPFAEAATLATVDHATPGQSTAEATEPSGARLLDIPADLANHPRYGIEELLGTGGMGAVYKAEHRLMQRTVALKLINSKYTQNKQAVERFRREVQAAARLVHPNIVHAYDAEQAGDVHFLVMEYVNGTDLAKVLEQRGPLPVGEACECIRQAALGLQHAHENGMVHRDIKPQNLMIARADLPARSASKGEQTPLLALRAGFGIVKILDFGLASLAAEASAADGGGDNQQATMDSQKPNLTQAGSLMGTPDYIAPEQARDAHAADIRSDIYSLGCTLYALLSGKVPFPGGTAIDKVIAHSTTQPQPIGELRKDLPASLFKILDKMMAKDPAQRYQTPAEVAAALAPLSPWGPGAGSEGRSRRNTLVAGLAAGLLLAAAGIIFYWQTNEGTVRFEINDPDIKVVMDKSGPTITGADTSPITIRTGTHGMTITRGPDFVFDTTTLTLKRGGETKLKIDWLPGDKIVVKQDGRELPVAKRPATPLGEFLEEYDLAVRWGRGKLDLREKEQFIALWGHQRSALINPEDIRLDATLHALELFGNLPEAAHDELKRTGVLHWRYADLDAARQKAFEVLQRKIDQPRKTPAALPEHWKQAHVGFVVVEFGGKKAVSAFFVLPTHSVWVAVVGGRHSWEVAYADAHARLPQMPREPLSTPLEMLVGGSGAAKTPRGESKADEDRIQGAWRAVAGEVAGKKLTLDELKNFKAAFKDETLSLTMQLGKQVMRVTGPFSLDGRKDPKRITFIVQDAGKDPVGAASNTGIHGIYRFKGERLVLCITEGADRRPTEFMTSPQTPDQFLLTLERQTAKPKTDSELVLGTWKAESAEVFGEPVPKEIIDTLQPTLTFTPEKALWKANPPPGFDKLIEGLGDKLPLPKEMTILLSAGLEGVYHLDPTRTPKSIDLISIGAIRKTMLGIYSLQGDTLRICVLHDPQRVNERPTEFATGPGVLRGMVILRRQTAVPPATDK